MKNKTFTIEGLNVYVNYTLHGRRIKELFCTASSEDNAQQIAGAFNFGTNTPKK